MTRITHDEVSRDNLVRSVCPVVVADGVRSFCHHDVDSTESVPPDGTPSTESEPPAMGGTPQPADSLDGSVFDHAGT